MRYFLNQLRVLEEFRLEFELEFRWVKTAGFAQIMACMHCQMEVVMLRAITIVQHSLFLLLLHITLVCCITVSSKVRSQIC